jgi:hypothetical protein
MLASDAGAERERLLRNDVLVLVVPGGLHDRSAYVFPVVGIAADVCEIQAMAPLDPGTTWDPVEIVGDRKLLRRASAHVLAAEPWYLVDGSPCFRCRLAIAPHAIAPERSYDLVTDPASVRRLLDFAGMTFAHGRYEAPGWGRGAVRFLDVGTDAATVELEPPLRANGMPRGHVRIAVDLFAVEHEMEVRLLSLEGGRAQTSLPLILRRRRRHRRAHRTPVRAGEPLAIRFLNPVTGSTERWPVREASFYAVRFRTDPIGSVLWEGLPLERAELEWRGRSIALGDLTVGRFAVENGEPLCTASVADARVLDDPDMIALLATLAHPDVRVYDGEHFDAMHAMYLEAGLFGPHMHRNLAPILEQTRDVWRRLHGGASDVVRTLVHTASNGTPDAGVTVMRAWEHGWLLQHFVDVSPRVDGATGKLQRAYLDHLVPRPDGRYLLFFVKDDNHVMNAYLTRFFASSGTREAFCRSVVELWSRAGGALRPREASPQRVTIRPMTDDDAVLVERAAERGLGAFAASALSLRARELGLPDTSARFRKAGLQRERDCRVLWCADEPTYALIEEQSTPGLNLTWMLNATWILPIRSDPCGFALSEALGHVLEHPAQSPTGQHFLNLPVGLDAEVLEAAGFQREASLYLYVLNRAGLHRFYHYAARRYGELEARSHRRRAGAGETRESPT